MLTFQGREWRKKEYRHRSFISFTSMLQYCFTRKSKVAILGNRINMNAEFRLIELWQLRRIVAFTSPTERERLGNIRGENNSRDSANPISVYFILFNSSLVERGYIWGFSRRQFRLNQGMDWECNHRSLLQNAETPNIDTCVMLSHGRYKTRFSSNWQVFFFFFFLQITQKEVSRKH